MSFKKFKENKQELPFARATGKEHKQLIEAWECQQPTDIYLLAKDKNGFTYVCLDKKDARRLGNYLLKISSVKTAEDKK